MTNTNTSNTAPVIDIYESIEGEVDPRDNDDDPRDPDRGHDA